jgi:hypothetical protein
MTFGGTDLEHLYTSKTHPYFCAPHVYVAFPMRFVPGRQVLSDAQARTFGVNPGYAGDAAETVFMTSRGGTFTTRPFRFSGRELVLNLSTGAAGGVFVEIQDTDGKPIPGYTRADALEQAGDEVERIVSWKSGTSVASLAGREIRLHFTLKDADLYALQFRP